ncbi:hypothetical protein WH96_13205 [Kiloniella spongiae]|uniref:UPF0262 protein WH96_13205 n=1 Tax=Kiloniella spongiae TaxID=1489064 RepID=A0A0H2MCR8_9PROT|nr:UPF0262 family protein [Kiloniella spongiae]KLN60143.1 hypothetical protein WH96_13205 [Kiloniella spongiae]
MEQDNQKSCHYLSHINLDETSLARSSPDVEKERAIAIYDILEQNHFLPFGSEAGPYVLDLAIVENRLRLRIDREGGMFLCEHILSLTPLRRVIKDYFSVCQTYFEAIKMASPMKIEAIDMGRRGLHNEGSEILQQRLEGKIEMDFNTARRLFTLICALHHVRGR